LRERLHDEAHNHRYYLTDIEAICRTKKNENW